MATQKHAKKGMARLLKAKAKARRCEQCELVNKDGVLVCRFCGLPPYAELTDKPDDYATAKARQLIADEFRRAGKEGFAKQYENGGFTTNPLRAFARYIASVE